MLIESSPNRDPWNAALLRRVFSQAPGEGGQALGLEKGYSCCYKAGQKLSDALDLTSERPPSEHGLGEVDLIAAAVLVPLVVRPEGVHVLLTQRAAHLHDHAGQAAFPGGRIDPQDQSPADAALRETQEEIGLSVERIELIGRLDCHVTGSGYQVTPFVGLIQSPLSLERDLRLNPFEVAKAFEVPLRFLMDSKNRRIRKKIHQGVKRSFYAFRYGYNDIWGATAGMLVDFLDRLPPE